MQLNYADYPTPEFGELPTSRFDEEVDIRHHKVVDIIRRHFKDIHTEILRLDPEMLIWTTPATRPRSPARFLPRWSISCAGLPRVAAADCRGEEIARVVMAESSVIASPPKPGYDAAACAA